jgi:predicted membrane protein
MATFGMTWVLISLFMVQILTLVCGVVFTISNRRIVSFEPLLLSIATLLLMTYTGERMSEVLKEAYQHTSISSQYQLGYYLVYPSVVMFVFAFLLNEVRSRKKMEASETAKENQNRNLTLSS